VRIRKVKADMVMEMEEMEIWIEYGYGVYM